MDIGEDILNAAKSVNTPFKNAALFPVMLFSLLKTKYSPDTSKTFKDEYDYIIVGAGSAGSVLANRLSERSYVSILLLEAGGAPPLISEIPSTERFLWGTSIDWNYKTVPQKNTGRGLKKRQFIYPSGKTLGGSSVLNDVIATRGNKKNYDDWAAMGATGWSYEDCLPYFKKAEDNRDPEFVEDGYHGIHGPQTIHRPRYKAEFKDPIFETIQSLGYNVVDPNGESQTGLYDNQGILRSGQLCSTAKAYLVPADNRTNLDILSNAMVRKVIIEDRTAVGVEFDYKGATHTVRARREVILSAGTLHTPKLLMLSGIGPSDELERLKIPVIADLPVGKNFHDHAGSVENFLVSPSIPLVELKLANPLNLAKYINTRTGPLAAALFVQGVLFAEGPHALYPGEDFPNYQLYFVEGTPLLPLTTFGMKLKVLAKIYGPYVAKPFYFCLVQSTQPRSRGTVTLKSSDPYDDPVIDPNVYGDERDIDDIVDGLKMCKRIGEHPNMKRKIDSTRFNSTYPGCEKYVGDDDLYYRCQVKSVSVTYYHSVGTAKMGKADDPTTVVDPQLRVKTIDRLRVVDASVMPIIPSGNSNIPTIMLAEKAADMIKEDMSCDSPPCEDDQKPPPNNDPNVTPWNEELLEYKNSSTFVSIIEKLL